VSGMGPVQRCGGRDGSSNAPGRPHAARVPRRRISRALHFSGPRGVCAGEQCLTRTQGHHSLTASRTRFDTSINYYQVLNVAPGATAEDITRAYRALMRVTHPDNFQEPMERSRAEDRTKLINAAYAVLSRPEVRIAYDDQMRTTAVSDALMQRYTGNAPGRTDPLGTRPRSRSPGTVRAQRRAYNSAVRQLMLMAAAFALALMLLIFVFGLAGAMWNIAWGWIVSLFS
jgi:hypothetical protein